MKVFLIILAVLVLLFAIILSISAEFTIIFDNGWTTKIRVLFIEKEIKLTKLLSFLIAPDKAGQEAAQNSKDKKKEKAEETPPQEEPPKEEVKVQDVKAEPVEAKVVEVVEEPEPVPEKPISVEEVNVQPEPEKAQKPNPIQKIINEDGIVGILLLISNVLQTANSAIKTLIKGLHIYSLYVKMIIGGGDAATIAEKFGSICSWYYPLKGLILNQMKVDNYDDLIQPDFIAPRSEYELQFIGSISVGLLLKVGLKAGAVFLINFIKNK